VQPRKVHPLIRDAVLLLDVLEGIDGPPRPQSAAQSRSASAAVMLPPPSEAMRVALRPVVTPGQP